MAADLTMGTGLMEGFAITVRDQADVREQLTALNGQITNLNAELEDLRAQLDAAVRQKRILKSQDQRLETKKLSIVKDLNKIGTARINHFDDVDAAEQLRVQYHSGCVLIAGNEEVFAEMAQRGLLHE